MISQEKFALLALGVLGERSWAAVCSFLLMGDEAGRAAEADKRSGAAVDRMTGWSLRSTARMPRRAASGWVFLTQNTSENVNSTVPHLAAVCLHRELRSA